MAHSMRVQRTRTKGGGIPSGAVYVGRPGRWGNPYSTAYDFQRVLTLIIERRFTAEELSRPVLAHMKLIADNIDQLRGKNLACWCSLSKPCHADVLAEIANRTAPKCEYCLQYHAADDSCQCADCKCELHPHFIERWREGVNRLAVCPNCYDVRRAAVGSN